MKKEIPFTLETLRILQCLSLEDFAQLLVEGMSCQAVPDYIEDQYNFLKMKGAGNFLLKIDNDLANHFITYANEKIARHRID